MSVIAIFIVRWRPTLLLTPCGLINGADFGNATIVLFYPKFDYGSLLSVVRVTLHLFTRFLLKI